MKLFHALFLSGILSAYTFGSELTLHDVLDKCIRPWQELKSDRQPLFVGALKNVEGFWFMHKDKIYFSKKPGMELQDRATVAQPAGKLVLPEDDIVVKVIYFGEKESEYRLGILPFGNGPGWELKKADLKPSETYLTGKHIPTKSAAALRDFQKAAAKQAESFAGAYVATLLTVEMKRGTAVESVFDKDYQQRLLVGLGAIPPETVFSQIDACVATLGSEDAALKTVRKSLESKLDLWQEAHAAGASLIEQQKEIDRSVEKFFRVE